MLLRCPCCRASQRLRGWTDYEWAGHQSSTGVQSAAMEALDDGIFAGSTPELPYKRTCGLIAAVNKEIPGEQDARADHSLHCESK